jgi:hypothetical protein
MKQYLHFFGLSFVVMTSIFTTGCFEEKMSINNIVIERVIQQTVQDANSLNIGYPLYLVGTGGGIDHDTGKEKMIGIAFDLHHPLSKEACRWLVLEIAQLFLTNINSDRELSKYLPEEKFHYRNLIVIIYLSTPERAFLYYPDIACVALSEGKISYAKNDPQHKYAPYKEVIYEPVEEALKIVESQSRPSELDGKPSIN